ncbi:MAG: VgrG-related protein [Anaerolineaceae bacterium]
MPADANPIAIPQFKIAINGSVIPAELAADLSRIEVDRAVFLPGMATLEFHDNRLTWLDDSRFSVGAAIKVTVGAFDDNDIGTVLFDGEITAVEPAINSMGPSSLVIRAMDKTHRLHRGSMVKRWESTPDSSVISSLVSAAGGLTSEVTSSSDVHDYVLQDNVSAFDLICRLARRNGFIVVSEGNKLLVKAAADFTTELSVEYFKELLEFRPVLASASQIGSVSVRGWDPKTKAAVVGQAKTTLSAASKSGFGASTAAKATSAFGSATVLVSDLPVTKQAVADKLAKATLADRWTRDLHGEGRVIGDPNIVPAVWLNLQKIGSRFSGKYFISRTRHVMRADSFYETYFWTSGMEAETTADLILGRGQTATSIATRGAGVAIGIVTNLNDPDGMGRVKLKLPWMDDQVETFWARIAGPMTGNGTGIHFMPEVNDEVLVAFDNGERGQPYVLGSLWNGTDKPPMSYDKFFDSGQVVRRQIKTAAGHLLEFDDTSKAEKFSVTSPSKRTIVFDDGAKTITVSDGGANSVEIDSNGAGKITIKTGGDVTVEAGGNAKITAKMAAEVDALSIKLTAKSSLELSGAMVKIAAKAMLDMDGGGIASLKGGLVKIN